MSRTSTVGLTVVGRDLHEQVESYQRQHHGISYGQAMRVVATEVKNHDAVERYALRARADQAGDDVERFAIVLKGGRKVKANRDEAGQVIHELVKRLMDVGGVSYQQAYSQVCRDPKNTAWVYAYVGAV